jgi:hypothetical protein
MFNNNANKIFEACTSIMPPIAVVVPTEGITGAESIQLLKDAKLWMK